MKPPSDELRKFMSMPSDAWPPLRRAARKLSDDDLVEADRLERLGRRRVNLLRILLAERKTRAGRTQKMLRLKTSL